jgi:hypothetical protein
MASFDSWWISRKNKSAQLIAGLLVCSTLQSLAQEDLKVSFVKITSTTPLRLAPPAHISSGESLGVEVISTSRAGLGRRSGGIK